MSGIYFHNTLSGARELFTPRDARRLTMYVCGPTVYGPAHVGNARPAAVFDLVFRLLRRRYGEDAVLYARNITDIDDKIIAAAAETGEPADAVARRWRDVYRQDMRALSILPPTSEPHATEYIPQMIAMIENCCKKTRLRSGKSCAVLCAVFCGIRRAVQPPRRRHARRGAG